MTPGRPSTVTLRPFTPADAALLTRTDSEFDDFGPKGADPRRSAPSSDLDEQGGLVVCADGEAVGSVSWHYTMWGPNAGSRCVMIGITLEPGARGRGIGTRAQALLAEMIFDYTRAHRVEAATEVDNVAEQRALERAGFVREGVVRGGMWRKGRHRDSVLYSRLRTDPAPGDGIGGASS